MSECNQPKLSKTHLLFKVSNLDNNLLCRNHQPKLNLYLIPFLYIYRYIRHTHTHCNFIQPKLSKREKKKKKKALPIHDSSLLAFLFHCQIRAFKSLSVSFPHLIAQNLLELRSRRAEFAWRCLSRVRESEEELWDYRRLRR